MLLLLAITLLLVAEYELPRTPDNERSHFLLLCLLLTLAFSLSGPFQALWAAVLLLTAVAANEGRRPR